MAVGQRSHARGKAVVVIAAQHLLHSSRPAAHIHYLAAGGEACGEDSALHSLLASCHVERGEVEGYVEPHHAHTVVARQQLPQTVAHGATGVGVVAAHYHSLQGVEPLSEGL